jgi:glyoxylase-like metal-dependent hydrolase (beta-lactamase superfamily II)
MATSNIKVSPLFFLLVFFLGACAHANNYEPVKNKPIPVQVSKHVYYVQGLPGIASEQNEGYNSNAGFAVTNDGVIVIDALGTVSLGYEFIKAIRSITDKPIKRVIITHYHADHVYGLQAFKEIGAEVWAHRTGLQYIEGESQMRLEQRRRDLFPWVNDKTRVVKADRWIDKDETFSFGGLHFEMIYMGPAHAPDDMVIVVREDQVFFSGDIIFTGRIPFVGEADSKRWLQTMGKLLELKPKLMVTGHGKVSTDPASDLILTRDYLTYLRQVMGKAVEDFIPFEEAYAKTDWSKFAKVPAFDAANRINAYGTYLLLEKESLGK